MEKNRPLYLAAKGFVWVLLITLVWNSTPVTAAEDDYIRVPIPDQFIPALQNDGTPQYISGIAIETEIRKFSPGLKKLYHSPLISQFIIPEHAWLDHLLETYKAFFYKTGIRPKPDSWDCENYSGMLNALTTLRLWKAGYLDTRAAIGWLRVETKKEWAGIKGELHALMFAVTSAGIFIIEPQNGQYVGLQEYPNRQYIEEVFLF